MLTKSQFCKWFMRKEKCYSCLSPFKDSQHCILTFCPITPDWNYCLGITCCKFITSRIKAHQVFVCFTCNVQIKEKWLSLAINESWILIFTKICCKLKEKAMKISKKKTLILQWNLSLTPHCHWGPPHGEAGCFAHAAHSLFECETQTQTQPLVLYLCLPLSICICITGRWLCYVRSYNIIPNNGFTNIT